MSPIPRSARGDPTRRCPRRRQPRSPRRPTPMPAPGSCCPPTTRRQPRGRSPRRSSAALPGATLLVVDDGSPDGTGDIADAHGRGRPAVRVRHRASEAGARAGVPRRVRHRARGRRDDRGPDGRRLVARSGGAARRSWRPSSTDRADLVIGSRYTAGGGIADWGLFRRIISRVGSLFARIVLRLAPHDLTGGFKAWRSATLAAVPFEGVRAGGYVFQIEMTYRASRARRPGRRGARSSSGTGASGSPR